MELKLKLIEEEIERHDLIGNCFALNPSEIKQDILQDNSFRLQELEEDRSLSRDLRNFTKMVYDFYSDITFYSWKEDFRK